MVANFGFVSANIVTNWNNFLKDSKNDHFGESGCAHTKLSLAQMMKHALE